MSETGFSAFPAETLQIPRRNWREQRQGMVRGASRSLRGRLCRAGAALRREHGARLKALSPGVRYEPKINGSIGRINRDVRFSRDKRPYKDHLDIWFWHGDKKGWDRPGFYLRVTPATIFLGSGMHMLEGEMLERFRKAVIAEKLGKALVAAIAKVKKAGPYEVGGATRKSVPRGSDPSHERARLLLHEGLYAGLELPAADAAKPGFADRALAHFAATWPIGKWLLDEVVP